MESVTRVLRRAPGSYKEGLSPPAVDALSRVPVPLVLMSFRVTPQMDFEKRLNTMPCPAC